MNYIKSNLLALALLAITPIAEAQTYTKTNGIISFDANMYNYPMISRLRIMQTEVMPYDNPGAGFQMTGRSSAGNIYNPTQAGDCTGNPSDVIAISNNWNEPSLPITNTNSMLFSVVPRNYNEPVWDCAGPGHILPYEFNFGISLGDGVTIPREIAVLDMKYTRWDGSEPIDKAQSEAPALFPHLKIYPFAYWSEDGYTFQRYDVAVNGKMTNDIRQWPTGNNHYRTGKTVMACTLHETNCIALHSNRPTIIAMAKRSGARGMLSYMTLTADVSGSITDFDTHHVRRIMATGTPSTIISSILQSEAHISQWGNMQNNP